MCRAAVVSLLCLADFTHAAFAADAPGLFTRVRSTQRFVISLIREGYERSPTFQSLVDTLQQSNVIVYVQPAVCAGGRIRSCLTSVKGSAVERHIRINVDTRTSHNALIATIAHELQHAAEIAERPDVLDAATARRLYREIGIGRCHDGLSDECETNRAIATEARVMEELFARPPGHPRVELQYAAPSQRAEDVVPAHPDASTYAQLRQLPGAALAHQRELIDADPVVAPHPCGQIRPGSSR
jgi:hypothetical protein